jgi:Transposase
VYPPPDGQDLTEEQALELDDTFLASDPFQYFRTPAWSPAIRTGRSPWPGTPTSACARSTKHPTRPAGGGSPEDLIATFPTCPVPEIARLGLTLRAWKTHVLARFNTTLAGAGRISNGGTEAVNAIIEKVRRLAHGFRTFDHYCIRILLTASGPGGTERGPTHA